MYLARGDALGLDGVQFGKERAHIFDETTRVALAVGLSAFSGNGGDVSGEPANRESKWAANGGGLIRQVADVFVPPVGGNKVSDSVTNGEASQ